MMKFLVLALIGVATGAVVPIEDYHTSVGIPTAARIKAAEEALDFDGARIVGGAPAYLGQFPYLGGLIITLSTGATSYCGSSLLTNTRGLTAAHCWRTLNNQAVEFTMVLASTHLFFGGTRVVTRDVEMHADYDKLFLYNDIAIMRLPWVNFDAFIQPIAIATRDQDFVGVSATVAGYGLTRDGGTIEPDQFLSHLAVQVISNAECRNRFGALVVDSTLCVTSGVGRGPCTSDSGGPLVANNQLIGVVSFGTGTCEGGLPTGFARVTSYASWILERW
ncbi:chymotrypsin-1-like [Leguminivora glycinivorella]|uniref:chymotrypsin-1-like n=1 Tax=Leguminivora glycinivorella TaxID=1035111 RepID=UPI00200F8E0F|nr:chymotrypsin-1-like [Leguminivora glycinivorella]